MEEVNNPPHSMGSGQPHHPVNHTRPFFYVQPPSQPYYMYQWHMNNPYGHYGFPGSGIPFGRPYMPPYPYMQYPGYIIPHAPMQPVDYRRMYNPHFPSAASYDVRFRHHHTRMRRETACSEAQTDPSDAVNQLIESLDKLRTRNTVAEKELDSGIISPNSFLPGGDSKHEGPSEDLEALPAKSFPSSDGARLSTSVALFGTSAGATCKSELSQSRFEELAQEEGWSVGSDGVLPLDSSSIHEESVAQKEEKEEEEEKRRRRRVSIALCA
ncbi:hypothetical protein AAFF_G00057540 [Aldrovandia affinis]|uniref:Uncharacterized protein n=1 Tax=Aldrovandia affinis TaxID=143900 RepID=A0AAD7WE19_9TELE|nr:hypothetical protein AAFF_G00057540 [Aldrovandia affinis]